MALPAAAAVTLQSMALPGTPEFASVARDVIAVRFAVDPSLAAGDGLFDDGAAPPSFGPETVAALTARLDRDMAALRAMPWQSWDKDRQIDWRWIYANAEDVHRQLNVEKLFVHRPSAWLEPLANTYIALFTYAPERTDIRAKLTQAIPTMVREMRAVCTQPTSRDVTTAEGVAMGIISGLKEERASRERDRAISALDEYLTDLKALTNLPEYVVIGRENYAWRLAHANLLPWTPQQLLAVAIREQNDVDAAIDALRPRVSPSLPEATPEQRTLAANLTQEKLLGLYDAIAASDRAFLDAHDLVTIPPAVGPIHARPTPEAMIPLTGDGGSMNPPPVVGESNVGWWNVEHFRSDWTEDRRVRAVVVAQDMQVTYMGPYAVHEGVPGHHLQLSLARLNPNPIRKLLYDTPLTEGWAMYAEWMFWQAGGLGSSADAENRVLGSWRGRIRRVFYDVNVECGDWTLQDASDFRSRARSGTAEVDEDVLRAINWPAQLIGYFTGKMQILDLKAAYKRKLGEAYTERKFHDALLQEGSIPVALIRAKLLDEPVPGI